MKESSYTEQKQANTKNDVKNEQKVDIDVK